MSFRRLRDEELISELWQRFGNLAFQPSTPTRRCKGFLDLPPELRVRIYEYLTNESFKGYKGLYLSCRQIFREVHYERMKYFDRAKADIESITGEYTFLLELPIKDDEFFSKYIRLCIFFPIEVLPRKNETIPGYPALCTEQYLIQCMKQIERFPQIKIHLVPHPNQTDPPGNPSVLDFFWRERYLPLNNELPGRLSIPDDYPLYFISTL